MTSFFFLKIYEFSSNWFVYSEEATLDFVNVLEFLFLFCIDVTVKKIL